LIVPPKRMVSIRDDRQEHAPLHFHTLSLLPDGLSPDEPLDKMM